MLYALLPLKVGMRDWDKSFHISYLYIDHFWSHPNLKNACDLNLNTYVYLLKRPTFTLHLLFLSFYFRCYKNESSKMEKVEVNSCPSASFTCLHYGKYHYLGIECSLAKNSLCIALVFSALEYSNPLISQKCYIIQAMNSMIQRNHILRLIYYQNIWQYSIN